MPSLTLGTLRLTMMTFSNSKEKSLERSYLAAQVKRLGGKSVKGQAAYNKGFPDRIVILPDGRLGFLELKSAGKKPSKLQYWWLDVLTRLGHVADWADSKPGIDDFLQRVVNGETDNKEKC